MIYIIEVFQIIKRWDDEVSKALMLLTVKLLYSLFLPLKDTQIKQNNLWHRV